MKILSMDVKEFRKKVPRKKVLAKKKSVEKNLFVESWGKRWVPFSVCWGRIDQSGGVNR